MISKRLATIASMVYPDMVIADIGSDHAFLPIYIIENKIVKKAYASDNKKGPLKHADENIKKAGLSGQITTYCAEGLNTLPSEVDCVIIAGMGGDTIIRILDNDIATILNKKLLIIEPNTKVHLLRKWLNKHQLLIVDEKIIKEYKYYQIIAIAPQKKAVYDSSEEYFGPILSQNCDSTFKEFYQRQYLKLKAIYDKNPNKSISEEFRILSENTRLFL